MMKLEVTGNCFIKADLKLTPKKVIMDGSRRQQVQGCDKCLHPVTLSGGQALLLPSPSPALLPPLDVLKRLNVLPKRRGPELDTALKVWPHQCRVQGKDDLPAPAGHTIPDPDQDAIGPLGHLGTLLAHVQLLSPVPPGPFPPGHCPAVALQGVVAAKVRDSAHGLVKLHPIGLCTPIQSDQGPLQSPPTLQL
ncbi:hypothetical protein DUI87_07863 [Hirundo rustica rustica]|uniref:Uncharacterized protein n=1 Tax=Hirundo rustica rustica TaxID=333673 RepID=A0A3M0KSK7_HIRRU|nr:hypothetical protein DUI87_07863 [Hirundo rustica rustica]